MGYIYLITNKLNNKKYVGQSICNDIDDRWKQHKRVDKYSLGNYLYNSYIKYGIENFNFQLICICFDEECNKFEREYIKKFNTLAPNGYNLKEGGNNSHQHPETKRKISEKLKGRKLSIEHVDKIRKNMLGKHHSDETKRKIGLKSKEYRNNEAIKIEYSKKFKGKKMNEDVKKRMYSTMTEENKINKNKNLLKGSQKSKKKVNQYTKDNIFIKSFDSMAEASKEINIHATSISNVCKGLKGYKTAGGYIWKFI